MMVWVEIDAGEMGLIIPIRIFRNERDALLSRASIAVMSKAEAVRAIRRQVFARDRFTCTHCGKNVMWHTGHMHERVWKSRGGEVSLANCTTLCYDCHLNDTQAGHGGRRPQFSKSS